MWSRRGINVWIWAASVALYFWIKDGGAAGELAWLERTTLELWSETTEREPR